MFDFNTLYIRPCSINILYIQIKLRFVYVFISTYINLKRKPKITTNKKQQHEKETHMKIADQDRTIDLVLCEKIQESDLITYQVHWSSSRTGFQIT